MLFEKKTIYNIYLHCLGIEPRSPQLVVVVLSH